MSGANEDAQLARLAQGGDLDAFEKLVSKYESRLHCFLCAHGANGWDVEDAVQETFLRLYVHIGQFDLNRRFSTWLFTISRRMLPRVQATLPMEAIDDLTARNCDPGTQMEAGESRQEFWSTIRHHTNDDEFQTLWFYYAEQLSLVEIASVMGESHSACKARISRVRRRLKENLVRLGRSSLSESEKDSPRVLADESAELPPCYLNRNAG